VVETGARNSILITYDTPRARVLEVIRETYPDISPERVHVWTLGGKSRESRLSSLWEDWRKLGVHLVEDGWQIPGGDGPTFNESGTYAPTFRVGTFELDGKRHLFICDGYAASAEAIQAASLDPIMNTQSALRVFSSKFKLASERERQVMALDPESPQFAAELARVAGTELDASLVSAYRDSIREAIAAGIPCNKLALSIDDFFPEKVWRVLAVAGYMLPDPYTGIPGIERVSDGTYKVWVRAATRLRIRDVALTLRLQEKLAGSRPVFSPLLARFTAGEDHRTRPVKVSDSGRIRNELQTLCSDALEFQGDGRIRVNLDLVDDSVLAPQKRKHIAEVLRWYKKEHPIWFSWLELDSKARQTESIEQPTVEETI
jgi:hypothetical protein